MSRYLRSLLGGVVMSIGCILIAIITAFSGIALLLFGLLGLLDFADDNSVVIKPWMS